MAEAGWRELKGPRTGAEAFVVTPFARLARAHAVAIAGDTLVTIALAGTLFFSIDPSEARSKVFLYLALTMAPFAVVAPLVGPALDRAQGGRRWMVVGSAALRAIVCAFMIRDVDSLLLFPEAFLLLVLSKSYQVAKSAIVPSTVHSDEELVQANSKLSLISGVIGFIAAVPGGILLQLGGSEWVLVLAAIVFGVGTVVSLGIPSASVASEPATDEEREELRSGGVLLAASAMGLFRGIVGFLTFLLAFALRTGDAPTWHFGVVLALSAGGALVGAGIAPILRQHLPEERIISALLVITAVAGVVAAFSGELLGPALIAATVGVGAAAAKQAFDAIVQRDAPDANRGRSFARFETRFQLIWVVGAACGIIPMPLWVGFVAIAGTATFAAVSYLAGSRGARERWTRRLARAARRRRTDVGFAAGPVETHEPELPPTIVTPTHVAPPARAAPPSAPASAVPPGVVFPGQAPSAQIPPRPDPPPPMWPPPPWDQKSRSDATRVDPSVHETTVERSVDETSVEPVDPTSVDDQTD